MSIPDSVQELHLREYQVQSRQMTGPNLNLSFSVPASTVALHLFLQHGRIHSGNPAKQFPVQQWIGPKSPGAPSDI